MQSALKQTVRAFHSSARTDFRVAVVGSYGGIGQPLALLCKLDPKVTEVSLYDLNPATPGEGADLSHINTGAKVTAYSGDKLGDALKGADIIIVPAGVPRKPGMTRDDLFNTNASIVANIAKTAAENAPNACHLIISNPVNSTVPIYANMLKKYGKYDARKVFGVTTLDITRANTFVSENLKRDVAQVNVPVVGGHAGITIIPLLSQVPNATFSNEDRDKLTHRIMFGGDEVVKAKAGAGSATLSMAYAGHSFASRLMKALKGESNVVECSYVDCASLGYKDAPTPYFSYPIQLGKNGVEKVLGLPSSISAYEKELLQKAVPELQNAIKNGDEFAAKFQPK